MIPNAVITAWRNRHPWPFDEQVEQDLVISRALVDIYSDPELAAKVAFRGGTALHKLFIIPQARYSEDIDLVQIMPHPVGSTFDRIRAQLEPWLGEAKSAQTEDGAKLTFKFVTASLPTQTRKLKVEINTRESFAVLDRNTVPFEVAAPGWFEGACDISTFQLEELLATKLRALHQRRKGRDLFDLALALDMFPNLDRDKLISCFRHYTKGSITRFEFEKSLGDKELKPSFMNEMEGFITTGTRFDSVAGLSRVRRMLIEHLP